MEPGTQLLQVWGLKRQAETSASETSRDLLPTAAAWRESASDASAGPVGRVEGRPSREAAYE